MPVKLTLDQFIQKANQVHNHKYSYEKTRYQKSNIKIIISCKVHGNFEMTPNNHLSGKECPECALIKRANSCKLTTQEFIKKAKKVHGDKYDYSNSIYLGMNKQINIICPISEHGKFSQLGSNHISGKGCPKCKSDKTSLRCKHSTKDFIHKAKKIHGNTYDYSEVNYIRDNLKIKIVCKKHGIFEQVPRSHLNGNGCPKCAGFNTSIDEFIESANIIHENKYNYSEFEYTKTKEQSFIVCPIHGKFIQSPEVHLRGCGCPKCVSKVSTEEIEIVNWLKSLNINTETSDRNLIVPKELDIVLPEYKIAIEYNGLYWHSSAMSNFNSHAHKEKTKACTEIGYKLLHIFSDDWLFKKQIVKSIIKSKLNLNTNVVYARKTQCKKISIEMAKYFLNCNHIQGYTISSFHYGLFFNDELLQVMSFKKEKQNFNLVRLASKLNTHIVGGASKLFKHFCRNHKFDLVNTFADLSLFDGNVYEHLGFKKIKEIPIDYSYVYKGKRRHKFGFRRKRLQSLLDNFDETKSELWNTQNNGIYRIYDCGKNKYTYME